jgi:molybdenum cofactor cytidylyltransferase
MGRSKALLVSDTAESFVARIVRSLREAGIDDVVAVLGHDREAIAEAMVRDRVQARIVVNEDFVTGQRSSVIAGLDAIDRADVEAMMLTLVDVPLFGSSTARAVIDRYRATGAPIVRPVRGDQHGHPIVIARSLFSDLRRSDPDAGIKPIVRAHVSATGDVPVDDDGAFVDVDTPERYYELFGRRLED